MSYISQLAPLRAAITAAGISTSVFFIGNATNAYFGAVPVAQVLASSLSNLQKAKIWLIFYDRAKTVMAGASIVSFFSFSTIAYLLHNGAHSAAASRNLALVGAATSVAVLPWTLNQMMPINHSLEAIVAGETAKEPYTDKLIDAWRRKHIVRMVLGGVSYLVAQYLQFVL